MDLEVKDVAELLNVTEETIERLIDEGKMPAYRLGESYRLSRIEIDNWITQYGEKEIYPTEGRKGSQQFSLFRAIHNGCVISSVPGSTKEELIRGTMELTHDRLSCDANGISDLLLDREKLMSTALGAGIAVPHTRDFLLKGSLDMIFVVFPEKPIDYAALDKESVHTLFFLFGCTDKRHLHLLSKIAHLSTREETLHLLKAKPTKSRFLDFVKDWESKLGS